MPGVLQEQQGGVQCGWTMVEQWRMEGEENRDYPVRFESSSTSGYKILNFQVLR